MKAERRFVDVKEIRAAGEENEMIIEGYPIVYNSETKIGPWFREIIFPGAATEALTRSDEIVLFNHDSNYPLARRSNGTLEVEEDDHGVKIKADLSGSARGREAHEMIKNGLITKMSFAFTVKEESWEAPEEKNGIDLRIIREFEQIFDYSPVTYPAYQATEVQARSAEEILARKPSAEEERTPAGEDEDPTAVLEPYELELNLLTGEQE